MQFLKLFSNQTRIFTLLGYVVVSLLSLMEFGTVVSAESISTVQWRGKTVLKFEGDIVSGSAERFKLAAELAKPSEYGYPILLLDSPGGSVDEAIKISEFMDSAPFHTVIESGAECASACASILFIGGRYRTVEPFGRFGQHSCSVNGIANEDCNNELAEFAVTHGVPYGAVAAYVTYVAPQEIVWMDREDVDGWGISRYPGVEKSGFEPSDPKAILMITGHLPTAQTAWRLDFWFNGWRAFVRPISDDKRQFQVSQFCQEESPGKLFIAIELVGDFDFENPPIRSITLDTDVFWITQSKPVLIKMDSKASVVLMVLPKENTLDWLKRVNRFSIVAEFSDGAKRLLAAGYLTESRENLIFAANHCNARKVPN